MAVVGHHTKVWLDTYLGVRWAMVGMGRYSTTLANSAPTSESGQ